MQTTANIREQSRAAAKQGVWILYPGDYEIYLGNLMNNRRTERGAFFPPFWKTDSHFVCIEFSKEVELAEDETIYIQSEGQFNFKLDGKLQFGMPQSFKLKAGKHKLNFKLFNQTTPPALRISGTTIATDATWLVTNEDKEWIDESGKASDTSATEYYKAEPWCCSGKLTALEQADIVPSNYSLSRVRIQSSSVVDSQITAPHTVHGKLYDFGKETFGYLVLKGIQGTGRIHIHYGESAEEALDLSFGETLDKLEVSSEGIVDLATNKLTPASSLTDCYVLDNSKALRYVLVYSEGDITVDSVELDYEYSEQNYRASFECSDEELNKIWEVGAYTMHLTTREFFIDGIKRDRWVWSGDAIQSYLMNYYLFFDSECVKRTIWLLRGKDPVTSHTNTIMDYSFYWFLSIYQYYMYTGDKDFVKQIYPRMRSLMQYINSRTNERGMVEGLTGDWVFVDWADGYLDKHGELSFEQVLFAKSLETMALCAQVVAQDAPSDKAAELNQEAQAYSEQAATLRKLLLEVFYNKDKKALVHNFVNGKQSESITRYANMFAVFFNYLTKEQGKDVKDNVLLNDEILKITTPYMRFYELEALCLLGEHEQVLNEMKAYWGGMLKLGATTFWEKYNPEDEGLEHLAMYGRPYGKSLCHAWGASPIYLLGKYYVGVQPTAPGYSEYEIAPHLSSLEWLRSSVPTPDGELTVSLYKQNGKTHLELDASKLKGTGTLRLDSEAKAADNSPLEQEYKDNEYKVTIPAHSKLHLIY